MIHMDFEEFTTKCMQTSEKTIIELNKELSLYLEESNLPPGNSD